MALQYADLIDAELASWRGVFSIGEITAQQIAMAFFPKTAGPQNISNSMAACDGHKMADNENMFDNSVRVLFKAFNPYSSNSSSISSR